MKNEKGQSLIEILLALATIVVIVTAISFSVISSLKNNEYGRDQTLATTYAQQGLEMVRTQRNNDYGTFHQLSGAYCLANSCLALSASPSASCGPAGVLGCGQNMGPFSRTVTVTQASSSCSGTAAQVDVTVTWTDSECNTAVNVFCHNVNLVSCLTDINPIQAP